MESGSSWLDTDADWETLLRFIPRNRHELARKTGALRGLRKHKDVDDILRMFLSYFDDLYSSRNTVLHAGQAHLVNLSHVSLLNRLRKFQGWFHALCVCLFEELNLAFIPAGACQVRVVDATTVREPTPRGSRCRLHYSLSLPSLACDFVKRTGTDGPEAERSLTQFIVAPGDHVLAGHGYSTFQGIRHVVDAGARLIVPVDTESLLLRTPDGRPFDLLAAVTSATTPDAVKSWAVKVQEPRVDGRPAAEITGWVCVRRKSAKAIRLAHRRAHADAARTGNEAQPVNLRLAEHAIVFATCPEPTFSAADVLEGYRLRWQVELVLEHFRAQARLGCVPTNDDGTKAWIYGKLLLALLVAKILGDVRTISLWDQDGPAIAPSNHRSRSSA